MVMWMAIFGIQSLLQRMDFVHREVFLTVSVTVLLVFVLIGTPYYGAKILGLEPIAMYVPPECYNDNSLLLTLANMTVALHLTLPIRWHILVLHEVAVVLVYGGCIFGSWGDPDMEVKFSNLALLTGLVF